MKQLLIQADAVRLLFDRRNRLQHVEIKCPEEVDADALEKKITAEFKENLNPEFSQPTIGIL